MMIDGRIKDGLRAGVAAFGVATGLMTLASTSQTPDGFIHASFGGPMDVFSNTSSSDVLTIGNGATDPSELAALLKSPDGAIAALPADSPIRAAFEAGSAPGPSTLNVPRLMPTIDPTAAPAIKDAATLPKPVVDSQGHVDCTGALSCKTDPVTNVTTLTFPDGVVAIVQKINDLTVVAYKTLTDYLPADVKALLPPPPVWTPPTVAAQAPVPTAAMPAPVTTAPAMAAADPEMTAPSFDPGPQAPDTSFLDKTTPRSGPRVNITRPPMDFSTDSTPGGGSKPGQKPVLGKVKDALGSAVNAVTDAVGKALSPTPSGKATTEPKTSGTKRTPAS